MREPLYIGIGHADITPPIGCKLAGYEPKRRSESIHDHLNLTVMVLAQGETRAILATADVVSLADPESVAVRKIMGEAAGVPWENIIFSMTHTHSGPVTLLGPDYKDQDPEYMHGIFFPAAGEAAKKAAACLKEAELGIGTVQSTVGINRRQIREDGTIMLGQEPLALYDPNMTVLSFRTKEGETLANLVHYGAHNTGSGKNKEISRDWCGVMVDRLTSESGGWTFFMNGCEGSCGPRLSNGKTTGLGDISFAMELGGKAAIDACTAWRGIREWRRKPLLKVAQGDIALPKVVLPSAETLEKRIAGMGDPSVLIGLDKNTYDGLVWQLEQVRSGHETEEPKIIRTTVISVGPVAFIPVPFEAFSGMTMRVSRHSPFPITLCASCGNGRNGYFPTKDQIAMGGYEVHTARSRKHYPFADDADQAFVAGAVTLLKQLWEQE